jgi:hypothetical protein
MNYYKTNALYEYIKEGDFKQFKFAVGNSWQLVYGDNMCQPKVLIFAVGVPNIEINNPLSTADLSAFNLLKNIATKTGLPIRCIRFACDLDEVESVLFSDESLIFSSITMPQLSANFGAFGLPVSATQTNKYLNDLTSSAFHKWQRSSLGSALTVSDIDMWKVDGNNEPLGVYELKRSIYTLERWAPFPDDYRNFKLLSNLCILANIDFKIIYNQRTTNPFNDDIRFLKRFSVNFSITPPISNIGTIPLSDLLNM